MQQLLSKKKFGEPMLARQFRHVCFRCHGKLVASRTARFHRAEISWGSYSD